METKQDKNTNRFGYWLKHSTTARMIMVGFLTLVLLIPLSLIQDLIKERSYRQQNVVADINKKWGEEVLIYGPILQIPYKSYKEKVIKDEYTNKVYTETVEHIEYAYFFPSYLDINGEVFPEEKSYGIYKTAVYESTLNITGDFTKPSFENIEVEEEDVLWDKARVLVKTSNLKGVKNQVAIKLNSSSYEFSSTYQTEQSISNVLNMHVLESKIILKKDLPLDREASFSMNIKVNGSQQVRFVPIGKTTTVELKSSWKTTNFFGEFLPYNKNKVHKDGFDAKWKVLDINRAFSQEYAPNLPNLSNYSFGVNFIIPVDEYQKSERSTKYGILVIGLTFLIFFLIQTMSKIPIHAFQYFMIGIALTMFYTLLISISEHSSFFKAYLIASISVVGLITAYSKSILKSRKFTSFIGITLSILYVFIFIIIQLENYALLVGSVGLFIILAMVMYASSKIDWNNS